MTTHTSSLAGLLLSLAALSCFSLSAWLLARTLWPRKSRTTRQGWWSWKPNLKYAVMGIALTMAYVSGFITAETLRARPYDQFRNVRVLKQRSPYDYQFRIEAPKRTIFEARFCRDWSPPPFAPGMTLGELDYQDRTFCWSIAPPHGGYTIVRDDGGKPLLAKGELSQ